MPVFTEEKIDLIIEMLKDVSYSYKDIVNKTGVSMTHIYNINIGKRRRRDNIEYPIRPSKTKGTRGLKFSTEECLEIHQLLKDTRLAYTEIAMRYGNRCAKETIGDINRGVTKSYRLEGWHYPIRDAHTVSQISSEYR